jgi:hypothetical protein
MWSMWSAAHAADAHDKHEKREAVPPALRSELQLPTPSRFRLPSAAASGTPALRLPPRGFQSIRYRSAISSAPRFAHRAPFLSPLGLEVPACPGFPGFCVAPGCLPAPRVLGSLGGDWVPSGKKMVTCCCLRLAALPLAAALWV